MNWPRDPIELSVIVEAVEQSADAIVITNPGGTIQFVNPAFTVLTGYSPLEAVGQNLRMIKSGRQPLEFYQQLWRTIQSGQIWQGELINRRKNGALYNEEMRIAPIRGRKGAISGFMAIKRDVTERLAAGTSRRFLASIVESSLDGIIAYTPAGIILTWNHGAETIFGYSAGEVIGHPISMLGTPEQRSGLIQYTECLLQGHTCPTMEGMGLRKDGQRIHLSLTLWPVRNSLGEIIAISVIARDQSERFEADKTRALLASIVESSEDAIYSVDLDGTILSWNRQAGRLNGYTAEEAVGTNIAMLVRPERQERLQSALELVRRGASIPPFEAVNLRKDGSLSEVSISISCIRDRNGKVTGSSAITRDIGMARQAATLLQESEERYRATFEQAPAGILHTSLDGKLLRCNARFAEMLGYSVAELRGMTVEQITAPEDLAASLAVIHRLAAGEAEASSWEKRYLRKNGGLTWARLTASVQRDGAGSPLHIISFIEDINDRKAAEQRLAATQLELRTSEERYRAAFQTSLDAVSITRLCDGRFIDANQACLDIMGFARDELIGKTSLELNVWVDPGDREKLVETLRLNSPRRNFESQIRTRSGKIIWTMVSAALIEVGGVPCIYIATRDTSRDKASAKRLAATQEALRVSEQRYRTTFQMSIDSMAINRLDNGMYVEVNPAFLEILGYQRRDVLGRTSVQLGIWADPEDRLRLIEELRNNSLCRNLEARFRKKNGDFVWGLMSASMIDLDGVPCVLSLARDISGSKAAADQIRKLAFYDTLTGLPNRQLLLDRLRLTLAASSRTTRKRALLFVDFDNFKIVNDTLGHQIGDLLLQEAARRLTACVRAADTVARLGGDEFVVMLDGLGEAEEEAAAQTRTVAEKILAALSQPYRLDGRDCRSAASIGITLFGDRWESTDEILQQADIAMYQANAAGRNTMRFFAPELQAAVNARAAMEDDLRQGLEKNQFQLCYQPQMNRDRRTGAEALIRWKHPRGGVMLPRDFIPLAEETGLILPIGDWVLNTVCAQLAAWAHREETAHLSLAVNVSARQFHQPEFVEQVLEALQRSGAKAENLCLELTESMLADNLEDIVARMTELKLHGVRFALDDFGTGYSSLSYLKVLPLDQVKIDTSFVRDILTDAGSAAIADAIISLGRALGLSVMAEGVETNAQRDLLTSLGCHSFQGNLFAAPLGIEEMEALFSSRNSAIALQRQ